MYAYYVDNLVWRVVLGMSCFINFISNVQSNTELTTT